MWKLCISAFWEKQYIQYCAYYYYYYRKVVSKKISNFFYKMNKHSLKKPETQKALIYLLLYLSKMEISTIL